MEINEQYRERLDEHWLKSNKLGCTVCVKRKTIQWLEHRHFFVARDLNEKV